MKEYYVQIIETRSRILTIEADNPDVAENIARTMYYSEEVELDHNDYDFTDFELISIK